MFLGSEKKSENLKETHQDIVRTSLETQYSPEEVGAVRKQHYPPYIYI